MDKFNELNLEDVVKLEDILTTTFLQSTDPNQLERSVISAKPEMNESLELPAKMEVDKLFNGLQKLALEVADGTSTSSNPQETSPIAFKYLTLPEFQQDDMFLLFEHEIPTCLDNSGTSNSFSSDASNEVFHTPEPSRNITAEDASELLIAFDVIPETPIDGANDLAIPRVYNQNEYIGDILVDFSLVENEMIPGRKDLENSPLDAGLVVCAFTSPCRELNSICRDVDQNFSSPDRQTFSVAKSLTPTALADASNSFELLPSFLALLPSPISSNTLPELEDDASWHLPNTTQVVPSTLVDNWNKTYRHNADRHNTDHREGTADDRPLDAPAFLRHTVKGSNWAIAPRIAPPVRRQSRQDGHRRGQLLEDSSQKLSTGFPATNYRFELTPMFKKYEKGKANSRSMLNQPNVIPKLPITTAGSSGSYLHHPTSGFAPESNLGFEMQTQDGNGDLCWPTGLATELGRLGRYSIPPAFDNDRISVSLVNANLRAHPSPSASWRSVSKSHPEIEQSILPHAETNLKNDTVPPPPRIPPMHRAHASSEKELIFHESSLPPLLGYSGFDRPPFSHISSTSSPLISKHSSGVKNQKSESNSLLQKFRPGYDDCPIYGPHSPTLDHIPPRTNLLPKKQSRTADSSFAFSAAKNGVPKQMRSSIPVSTVNKGHVPGSSEIRFVEKEILTPQANRNQQFATFTEQSQLPCRTSNLDNAGPPTSKASQSQPRVGTERFSNIGRSSRSTKPDRFDHIHPVLRGGRVIDLRAKKDDTRLRSDKFLAMTNPDVVEIKTRSGVD